MKLAGPSAELLENMGHTHNTLGQLDDAIACFRSALEVVRMRAQIKPGYSADEHSGGLHLGLGTTLKRQGKLDEAFAAMSEALAVFKRRFGAQDHSLVAKTLSGLAEVQILLSRPADAHASCLEAVRVFKVTCGVSPLTANALHKLGKSYVRLGRAAEALACMDESLDLHVGFDTLDLTVIIELFGEIIPLRTVMIGQLRAPPAAGGAGAGAGASAKWDLNSCFARYVAPIETGYRSLVKQSLHETDDAGAYYKCAGEYLLLAGTPDKALMFLLKVGRSV